MTNTIARDQKIRKISINIISMSWQKRVPSCSAQIIRPWTLFRLFCICLVTDRKFHVVISEALLIFEGISISTSAV